MQKIKVAILGNPNAGKTTLFNYVTGLNQKTGNYSGVTVEKTSGFYTQESIAYEVIDFPGTYSIYPSTRDEQVVFNVLNNQNNTDFPDKIIVVIDANNLKRGLLLFEQIRELGIETIIALNFINDATNNGMEINIKQLAENFNCEICVINAKKEEGIIELFSSLKKIKKHNSVSFNIPNDKLELVNEVKEKFSLKNNYIAWQYLAQQISSFLNKEQIIVLTEIKNKYQIIPKRLQVKETLDRYTFIDEQLKAVLTFKENNTNTKFTEKFDKIATDPIWGYFIFFFILLFIFQLLYSFAAVPMDFIDASFSKFALWIKQTLPTGLLNELVSEAIVPGIGGVVIFIPQIAILFAFLYFLEESGYMSRAIFLLDRWLKPFGMSGKSVLPLTLGIACAVPAIMSTRNIHNNKDRLITILVTPFVTCSARLPIYTILIALVIPNKSFYGLNLQGLTFLFMYLLGFISALLIGFLLQLFLKSKYENYLVMEMPDYRLPSIKGIGLIVWQKVGEFIKDAGKIILAISIILWVLANNSPTTNKTEVKQQVLLENSTLNTSDLENKTNSLYLEKSYLGILGKTIEPIIKPLGYDWKIGIGIISSLIAREVFIGTVASIYSIGADDANADTLKQKMQKEINPNTNKPTYNLATGWSLLLFYAFSMQCISTLAVVKRETKSWKWPLIQFAFMTLFAYICSFAIYSLLK